jgi:hypothetical protein
MEPQIFDLVRTIVPTIGVIHRLTQEIETLRQPRN